MSDPGRDLSSCLGTQTFSTVMADPPWRFLNRTGKVAPEHRRLSRYTTLTVDEICSLPVGQHLRETAHCYLWVPNALLPDGLQVLQAWGFQYKTNLIWHKVRKDGGSDGRGVGFYFRNVTEMLLFGIRGKSARTLAPGRRQVNLFSSRKRDDADGRRDMLAARGPAPSRNGPLLPVGAECVTAGRSAGASGLGVPVQDQFDLAQGEKGWRVGRTWSRLLLPQRDGDASVWDTGEKRPHVGSGASPGQSVLLAQAGAFPQTRRTVHDHREL